MSTSLWEFRPCPCTEEAHYLDAGELPAIQMGQLFLALCIQMRCPIKKQVVLRRWYHVHPSLHQQHRRRRRCCVVIWWQNISGYRVCVSSALAFIEI